ncbi:MAG: pentapeptide repeat-containing protein [Acidimicrobiia bacterium]
MAYQSIAEPWARPPERTDPGVGGTWSDVPALATDFDLGELSWQRLDSAMIDLAGLARIEIEHCHLKNVTFANAEGTEVALAESIIEGTDLSRLAMVSVTECLIGGAKLVGTSFSGNMIRDTEFDGCVFRFANLRMGILQRVAFVGCTIEDVDAYGADFEDVSFDDSTMSAFSVDQATATRVDLRGCALLGLTAIGRLDGFLVSDDQLFALAPQLAEAAGLTIEAGA